jgi:hypothetical protein
MRLFARLALTRTVFEHNESRNDDDASLRLLDSLAESIASGKAWQGRGAESTCRGLTLLTHLQLIEEHLNGMPKAGRNASHRALWLKKYLPPLLERLAGIPCGQPFHKARHPSTSQCANWARMGRGPLAETILAHHHGKALPTIHKHVSRVSSRLADL